METDSVRFTGYTPHSLFPDGVDPSQPLCVVTNPFLVYRLMREVTSRPLFDLIGVLDAAQANPLTGVFIGRCPSGERGPAFDPALTRLDVLVTETVPLIDTETALTHARAAAYTRDMHDPSRIFPPPITRRAFHNEDDLVEGPYQPHERHRSLTPLPRHSSSLASVSESHRIAFTRDHPWIDWIGLDPSERAALLLFMSDTHLFDFLRTLSSSHWISLSEANPDLTRQTREGHVNPSAWIPSLRALLCQKPSETFAFVLPYQKTTPLLLNTLLRSCLDHLAESR